MPIYTVEIDGKEYDLEGDQPPTEAEARAAIGTTATAEPPQAQRPPTRMAGIDFVPDEQWDALPLGEKIQGGLRAAGTIAGQMLGLSPGQAREKVDNPKATMAEFAIPGVIDKVGAGMKAGARTLYRSALKPGKGVREATIAGVRRSGGDVATEELLKNSIPITRSGKGQDMARQLVTQSRQGADDLIAAAEANGGATIPPIAALGNMKPVVDQARNTAGLGKANPMPGVIARAKAFMGANPDGMSLTQAQALKRTAQAASDDTYRAMERGQVVDEIGALFDKQQATGLRQALEQRVPGLAAQNANTQRLGTAARAVAEAEGRIANNNMIGMGDALALGSGIAGTATLGPEGALLGVLQSLLTRPETASRIAIGGYKAGGAAQNEQVRRVLAALMSSHQATR